MLVFVLKNKIVLVLMMSELVIFGKRWLVMLKSVWMSLHDLTLNQPEQAHWTITVTKRMVMVTLLKSTHTRKTRVRRSVLH